MIFQFNLPDKVPDDQDRGGPAEEKIDDQHGYPKYVLIRIEYLEEGEVDHDHSQDQAEDPSFLRRIPSVVTHGHKSVWHK